MADRFCPASQLRPKVLSAGVRQAEARESVQWDCHGLAAHAWRYACALPLRAMGSLERKPSWSVPLSSFVYLTVRLEVIGDRVENLGTGKLRGEQVTSAHITMGQ